MAYFVSLSLQEYCVHFLYGQREIQFFHGIHLLYTRSGSLAGFHGIDLLISRRRSLAGFHGLHLLFSGRRSLAGFHCLQTHDGPFSRFCFVLQLYAHVCACECWILFAHTTLSILLHPSGCPVLFHINPQVISSVNDLLISMLVTLLGTTQTPLKLLASKDGDRQGACSGDY